MRLLTGFPGFLGTEFMDRILKGSDASFVCLIQGKFEELARSKIQELEHRTPGVQGRIQLLEGDITLPGLGIPDSPLLKSITQVYHFAAVYDLNVREELGRRVNVEGTRNVLDFIKGLPSFKRFHYVSTCYVSGKHAGVFRESDLSVGQKFNNFYESTKYEAEVLVRNQMNEGLPCTIYRPAIVVGDSRTGVTQKYDGPYFVIQWLLRQGRYAILPQMGNPSRFCINLVPSDFVIDAMAYLAESPATIGKTYQLADPNPLTIAEVVQTLSKACGKSLIEIPIPKLIAKFAVGQVPGLENWLGIPRSSLDYFVHPTTYDTTETLQALNASGIRCPSFDSYAQTLVDYRIANPDIRKTALT